MSDSFLPPVVIALEWNDDTLLAGVARDKAALDELQAKSDESMASAGGSMKGLSDDSDRYLAGDVAGNLQHVGDTADDTADRVHDSAGRMSGDLENIGEGAVAGSTATKDAMQDASKGVDDAEKDVESKSKGFSGRVSKVFSTVGSSMSNWGIPFGHTVSDVGSKIDEAETKGHGFSESLVQVGKVATAVAGVALVGFAAESIHMADEFDVANVQLQNAIKNTGGSVAALQPQISATDARMAHLGFNSTETAKALTSLTIATKSPTTAMSDMGAAADLARAKNMSLESATATLTKVYAGSTRALTTLGLNLDIGTGKLKSIQSATESVKSAQLAYKIAQEEAAEATGEKAVAADGKLAEAHLKLEQAQTKLRMDTTATGEILSAVKQRTEGAAEAYGHTLAGAVSQAKASLDNFAVDVGEKLIPIVTTMIGVISSATVYVLNHKAVLIALAALVAGPLSVAIAAFTVSKLKAFGESWIKVGETVKNFGTTVANVVARLSGTFATQEADTTRLAETTTTETGQMELDFESVGAKAGLMADDVEGAATATATASSSMVASFAAILPEIALVAGAIVGVKELAKAFKGEANKESILGGEHDEGNFLVKRGQEHLLKSAAGYTRPRHEASGVEGEILTEALSKGLSANAAAGLVGNAAQESSLTPGDAGGGLYQMSGYPASYGTGSGAEQTARVIGIISKEPWFAQLQKATSPQEAAHILEVNFEKPEGSQPGETATTNNRPHREQAAAEAAKRIETAPSTVANNGLKNALATTKSKVAEEGTKKAIETAKLNLTEAKKVFSTAFGELAKLSEKLLKYTLAKGGVKSAELRREEEAHEAQGLEAGVASARANLAKAESPAAVQTAEKELAAAQRKQQEAEAKLQTAEAEKRAGKGSTSAVESAESSVESAKEATGRAGEGLSTAQTSRTTEIASAQEALNNALYAQKVATVKKEAAVEEEGIAKENAAKESGFTQALNQLKAHLEKGKTSTKQGMAEIEKVLKQYGLTFGTVGKDAGDQWVKQFEVAIKRAAKDSGGIMAALGATLHIAGAGAEVPKAAAGGIVTSPTLLIAGEAGPEAIIPLRGLSTQQPGALPALGGSASGGSTVINLYSTVNTNAPTSQQTINEQYQRLRPLLMGV
jgi:hypothetical protein